eukprot:gene10273-10432_t
MQVEAETARDAGRGRGALIGAIRTRLKPAVCSTAEDGRLGKLKPHVCIAGWWMQLQEDSRRLLYAILIAQLLSVALAITGCSNSNSSQASSGEPLSSTRSVWLQWRRNWLAFAALAVLDVEANTLVTKAYQYTSLTSVTLLDCFTIPSELLLADIPATELLAFLGILGAIISGLQALLLERQVLLSAHWLQPSVAAPMAGFALAMFFFYSAVPGVLIMGGAAVLNLSLLTSDAWSALARFMWFGGFQGSTAAYFVASLALVAGGITLDRSLWVQHEQVQPELQQRRDAEGMLVVWGYGGDVVVS